MPVISPEVKAAYDATTSALDHVRSALSDLLDNTADPDDRNEIQEKLEEVDGQIQQTTNEFLEYQAGTIALNPPSSPDLDEIKQNAAKVAQLTTRKATAAAFLKLATDASTLLSEATA